MEQNEKKKLGFNLIDIVILLGFVLIISVFSYYAMGRWETNRGGAGGKSMLLYTVEVKDVPLDFATAFAPGDVVQDVRKGANLGKIVSVEPPSPYLVITENKEEGQFALAPLPERYMTRVTIETAYKQSAAGYSAGDVELKVGKGLTIKTPKIAVDTVILSMDRKGGAQ